MTENDYKETLSIIDTLMFAERGTEEGKMLDALVTCIEAYEREVYPLSPPYPIKDMMLHVEQKRMNIA